MQSHVSELVAASAYGSHGLRQKIGNVLVRNLLHGAHVPSLNFAAISQTKARFHSRINRRFMSALRSQQTAIDTFSRASTLNTSDSEEHPRGSTLAERLLSRVRSNDRAGGAARHALPFLIGGRVLGRVLPPYAEALSHFPSVFLVTHSEVRLIDKDKEWNGQDYVAKRSEAVRQVLEHLRDKDTVPALRGWRNEPFAVRESLQSPPELIVERAAAVLFGVPAYGVFLNGYTCEGQTSPTHVWIGKRVATKATWPGRLDALAAGGLAAGMLPVQAMINECAEEAGIQRDLVKGLKAVSAVGYTGFNDDMWGLKRDQLFCFDLELPPEFKPLPVDGEMDGFEKIQISDLITMLAMPVRDDDSDNLWKPNVGVVLIDFLVRHGFVDADDPSFLDLVDALRGAK